jgi:hypothetical protein
MDEYTFEFLVEKKVIADGEARVKAKARGYFFSLPQHSSAREREANEVYDL